MASSAHAIGKFFNVSMDVRKLRRLPISSNFRETRWRLKSAVGSLTYQIEALRNTNLTSRNLFRVQATSFEAPCYCDPYSQNGFFQCIPLQQLWSSPTEMRADWDLDKWSPNVSFSWVIKKDDADERIHDSGRPGYTKSNNRPGGKLWDVTMEKEFQKLSSETW